jgi:hypothetical protein
VHRYFQSWVRAGVFERILREAGGLAEERGAYRLYECFVDRTFSKARDDGVGLMKSESRCTSLLSCGPADRVSMRRAGRGRRPGS